MAAFSSNENDALGARAEAMVNALGAGLVFLAPVYYGPEMMPQALRVFSRWLPTTFAANAVQTTLAGGRDFFAPALALALTAVVTLAIGLRLMKWRED